MQVPCIKNLSMSLLRTSAGLGLGAKLDLDGSEKHIHRGIGIAVFALILLQVPSIMHKTDTSFHKKRPQVAKYQSIHFSTLAAKLHTGQ